MQEQKPDCTIHYDSVTREFNCSGVWDISNIQRLQALVKNLPLPENKTLFINGKGISKIDSAGIWFLSGWKKNLEAQGYRVELTEFSQQANILADLVQHKIEEESPTVPEAKELNWVTRIGFNTTEQLQEFQEFLAFIGLLTFDFFRVMTKTTRTRIPAYAASIYQNGFMALPIIALLSFMIGVVISYQISLQLLQYGANQYIVDFLGLSILREFGPLLTAIMVAGRTGSAYTAQIGMMKLNQEIDALNTMGVTPAEVLLIPRIIALLIVLPLLSMWANIFGIAGGMLMASNMLNISCYDFLQRFPVEIPLKTLFVGLGKTPVFALIIGSIGCFLGMRVSGGAESVGKNTTRSVVLAIFFILVADAMFSVIFSKFNL